jgi:septal ring factor EnvC (AmiA/AmiB activator)
MLKALTIAALLALAACDQQPTEKDAALDDKISDQIHDDTNEQFNNISDELQNVDSRLNDAEATQAEFAAEVAKEKQSNDDLEMRLADVEQKVERLPD